MKIKTILVPTDFSVSATNAAHYALSLAVELNASLILYHTYHIPVPTAEMPIMVISPAQLEKDNMQRLDHFRNELKKGLNKNVHIECICGPGFAAEEIGDIAVSKKADLIAMGISGGGKITHALLGSVTTAVLKEVKTPLLVVPEKARYKGLSKIAFACDYELGLNQNVFLKLKDFVTLLKAHLYVVGIRLPEEELTVTAISDGRFLETELKGIPHTYFSPQNADVTKGLVEFEEKHPVDLLVMMPRKHSFFSRIFNTSITKDMVFHSHTPILALHE